MNKNTASYKKFLKYSMKNWNATAGYRHGTGKTNRKAQYFLAPVLYFLTQITLDYGAT